MRQRRTVFTDPELTELFGDDPEALRVLDAVARIGTELPTRRRTRARALGFAAVCAAAVLSVAALTTGGSSAGVIERARQAFGNGQVIRVTLLDERVAGTILNRSTGRTRAIHHVIDEWYDSSHQVRRVRDSLNGTPISDIQVHAASGSTIDAFAASYHAALRNGNLTSAGTGLFGGRPVFWLAFRPGTPGPSRVGVDQMTFKPAVVEYGNDRSFRVTRALSMAHQTRVPRAERVRTLAGDSARASNRLSIQTALSQIAPIVIPGRVGGLVLVNARRLTTVNGNAVQFFYKSRSTSHARIGAYLRVIVSKQPLRTAGWTQVQLTTARDELYLESQPGRGFVHSAGEYLAFEASQPRLIVTAWQRLTE